jgi:hypothetical protein
MKRKAFALAMALGLFVCFSSSARADITLDLVNTVNGNIEFIGGSGTTSGSTGTFHFNTGVGGHDFQITGDHGGNGSALSLLGDITGVYDIGQITTMGNFQTANVTGEGNNNFMISDGSTTFSAHVNWIDIFTMGTTGGINSGGTINLSSIVYTGSNADLKTLAADASANGGTATISFQFIPAESLTNLTASGADHTTSYSGNVTATAVPAPAGAVLALTGLPVLGIGGWLRRRKQPA